MAWIDRLCEVLQERGEEREESERGHHMILIYSYLLDQMIYLSPSTITNINIGMAPPSSRGPCR